MAADNLFSLRPFINKLRPFMLAVGLTAAVAAPAAADMCDQPPFGIKHVQIYDDLVAILGSEGVHDMLHNICRAKFMHDAKYRKALHRIMFSDDFIDNNDVGYIAIRVLEEAKRCIAAHPGNASGC